MRWQWPVRLVGVAFGFTALVGALHTPLGHPLLLKLAAVAGCPIARVTPEQIEAAQMGAFDKLRGPQPAPARPALGFTLERTTLADIREWAHAHGLPCEESRQGTLSKCDGVSAEALAGTVDGKVDEVAFGFRLADHTLVNSTTVTTLQGDVAATDAAARLDRVAARLRQELGNPASTRLPGAAWDGSHPAYVSYRFSDYLAEASAMRLPDRGVMLREHYVSARVTTPSPEAPANHGHGSL